MARLIKERARKPIATDVVLAGMTDVVWEPSERIGFLSGRKVYAIRIYDPAARQPGHRLELNRREALRLVRDLAIELAQNDGKDEPQ